MTGRNRILKTIYGEKTDRTAVCPFIYNNVVKEMYGSDCDVITETVNYANTFGFDLIHRNFNIRYDEFKRDNANFSTNIQTRGGVISNERKLKVGNKVLTECEEQTYLSPNLFVTAQTDFFIKEEDDLQALIENIDKPDSLDLQPLDKAKKLTGENGVVAPWYNGVFNYMSRFRKLDDLLIDPYVDEDFYHKLAQFCLDRLTAGITPVLEAGIDLVSYSGNIASGKLVGPNYFEEFILPYEKKLIDYIKSKSLGVIYHNCGYASNMIDVYNKLDITIYESMTKPPYADNSIEEFAKEFNQNAVLMGNIDQIDFLKTATVKQVENECMETLQKAAGRKFILGTSDFLEEGTPKENLLALAKSVKRN